MIILRTGILYSIIICAFISLSSLYSAFLISLKTKRTENDIILSAFLKLFGLYWAVYLASNFFAWLNMPSIFHPLSYVLVLIVFLIPVPLFYHYVRKVLPVFAYFMAGIAFYLLSYNEIVGATSVSFWGVQTAVSALPRSIFIVLLMLPLAVAAIISIQKGISRPKRSFFIESVTLLFIALGSVDILSATLSWQLLLLRSFYVLIGFASYFYLSGEEATARFASKISPRMGSVILRLREARIPFFTKLLLLFILLSVIPITGAGFLLFVTFKEIIDLYIYKPLLWNLKLSKEEFLVALNNVQIQAFFLILFTVLLVIMASSIASRAISQSLKRIGFGMKRIEEGDLGYKLTPESNDEIGDLAGYFNKMASEIKRSREIMENWNKELEKTVAERTKILQSLYDLSKAMGSTLNLDELLERSIDHIPSIAESGCISIFLVNDKGDYAVRAARGCPPLPSFKAGMGLFGEAVLSPQIVKIADIKEASQSEKSALSTLNVRTLLLVPMETKGKKVGLLFMGVEKEYTPSDIELNLISTIADQMAIAIENANVFEKEKEAVKRLMDIDNMKTELISMVSHELRTPITSIKGFLAHFITGTTGPVNETQLKFLKIMSKEGDQLLNLVDNLLEFSRIEREGHKYKKEALKIDAVISSVIEAIQPQLDSKNIKLTLKLSAGDAGFFGDDMKIGQVLKNLIGNAIKFSKEDPKIEISTKALPSHMIEVRVSDNGIGLSSEHLNKLFQKFYQVDGSLTRKIGGLGLGLAISKEIVEAHRGSISAESEGIGNGSSFIFTLPMIK